ncbi:SOS response-associated peptidase [Bifidobacterium avesanii]|uniref:Abasic site processing protein n=1 Tax=Bifidobacterium avesanii TaxID=1798157 RepID=A0A7K3TGG3_9BIFI|nr:SOS response-associated peptidase [Bifidobacterium avesanii]KAB8287726.1 SOS response associated peptidase (SRAP) [Bifidobacterium avesanii]NEG78185.1 SOS response-associated peptidase [Bifidobacterium avesanii]
MCRRFALDLSWDGVAGRFGVDREEDAGDPGLPAVPSYRFEPGHVIGIVARDRTGRRRLAGAHWSLVPRWSRGFDLPYPTYNARAESAASRPTFSESVRSMRAVVPATGYYEFKGDRPFYFHMPDDSPLAMAGLYSWWRDPAAGPAAPWRLTATVLTCPALDGFSKVHDRMPLLVPPDMVAAWLGGEGTVDGVSLLDELRGRGPEHSRSLRWHEVAPPEDDEDGRRLIAPIPDAPNATGATDAMGSTGAAQPTLF